MIGRARLRDDVTRRLGVPAGVPLLILVSKYVSLAFSIEEKEALYRTVREAIVRLGHPAIVVKAHPNEDVNLLRQQAAAWGWADAIVTREYDVHRLFAAADAAIMVTSMAGLEAMALGCPVVAVQTAGKDFEGRSMPAYVTARAVVRVDMGDGPGLAKALATLLDDRDEREALIARGAAFAAPYVHPVDGRLGERVLAAIQEIAADGNVIAAERPS
jgi:glycosyltransferase involved in cell wall biosynthesis